MTDKTTDQTTTAEKTQSKQQQNASAEGSVNGSGAKQGEKKTAKAGENKDTKKKPSRGGGEQKERSEFEQKVIDIRRVTRVVAGGRRFGFRVTVVIGDMKGRVGVGVDKGGDTAVAIEKAVNRAKKNMIKVNLTENMSVPHETQVKYEASELLLRPSPGRGIVAGSAVRSVMQMAGVTDVVAKLLSRSGNKLNNARVAVKALQSFE